MNKQLPVVNKKGFTLVELLIVISIIAVLAIISIAVYGSFQSKARDARRDADIEAIAAAMEGNYADTSTTPYSLSGSIFSDGKVPTDPTSGKAYCWYSAGTGTNSIRTTDPAAWAASTCPAIATVYTGTALTATTTSSNQTWWKVCTTKDNGSTVACKSNAR
jgi:prepilin-type N-terminal cleavage/methylation domain-containing protein